MSDRATLTARCNRLVAAISMSQDGNEIAGMEKRLVEAQDELERLNTPTPKGAIVTEPGVTMGIHHSDVARHLLESYDAFLSGGDMDPKDMERFKSVCAAISFGAAAYEAGHGDQAAHAMGRSFLLALIDPSHPDLDYLRADPRSGEVARLVSADLAPINSQNKEAD